MDDIFHLCARDWFAEKVARLDGGLNGVALQNAGRGRLYCHLVLGLFVLLNVEAAVAGVHLPGG